ncbi:MAG: hypothetical protein L6R37_002631 [Teloschistes peruensis]|nr:MAG: hypothetical protein L6R37_002631 [Teloschistes peruensis]
MSGQFTVPFSSSPPSTPDSRRDFGRGRGLGTTGFASHPSTTPAGPPPSSTNSFTPAGHPPPSSIFGSSNLSSGTSLRSKKHNASNGSLSKTIDKSRSAGITKSKKPDSGSRSLLGRSTPLKPDHQTRTLAVPVSSPLVDLTNGDDGEWSEDDMEEADEGDGGHHLDVSGSGSMRFESPAFRRPSKQTPANPSIANGALASSGGIDWARSNFGSSVGAGTPRSIKRPRDSIAAFDASSRQKPPVKRQKKESSIPGIIHNLAAKLEPAELRDSDDLILGSEACMGRLYQAEELAVGQEKAIEDALPEVTKELCSVWDACGDQHAEDTDMEDDVVIGIGPSENTDPFQKATFVAPLLLQIHHPPPATGKQAFASSRSFRSSHLDAGRVLSEPPLKTTPIPKVLKDWLEYHHNPYASGAVDLQFHTPNPTAHMNYWDVLFNMLLRGKVFDVTETLKVSNFQYARVVGGANGSKGYSTVQLDNIRTVVGRMDRVLRRCPILGEDDWEISGSDWSIFRKHVEHASADLTAFVEGNEDEKEPAMQDLEAPNFGLQSTMNPHGRSSRNTERKIPSLVYENLRTIYGILLGKTPEIVSSAQNWVEATVGLTIWWDGEDDDDEDLAASLIRSRRSLGRSQNRADRTVDINPIAAYVRRLAAAFERVTDDDDPDLFQINSNNPVEVALASVFEGNVEGVIGLLHCWSLPVAAAVAEIANLGGWFESSAGPSTMTGFDQEDLLVLSYAKQDERLTPDEILVDYAEQLFEQEELKSAATGQNLEGWEVSMQVLSRLDDEKLGIKKLGELLEKLPLASDKRVDRLLNVCQSSGLDAQASDIAKRWADYFTNETENYGNALIYYARARLPERVKNVLDILISFSIVESKAYPSHSSLDENLRSLVEKPKASLAALASLDTEAAEIIHLQMTGYASLRIFFDLRDQEVNSNTAQTVDPRPVERRKAAISTLIAVINSAADSIHGGLYDEGRGSIIPVDGLLALLGEALVFVDQPQRELTLPQCFDLLKAIEDLQTVTSRVYKQCEECFRRALANGQTQPKAPDRRETFKKSISNITTSSSAFSLIDSMMESETRESTGSEGVMIRMVEKGNETRQGKDPVQRGWDWREGVNQDLTAGELLKRLRLGLAKDIAKAWVEGEGES